MKKQYYTSQCDYLGCSEEETTPAEFTFRKGDSRGRKPLPAMVDLCAEHFRHLDLLFHHLKRQQGKILK